MKKVFVETEECLEIKNEIEVLKSLSHPYIVKYYESFTHNGIVCIIMEYAEKGKFGLKWRGPWKTTEAIPIK